jgi:phosphatidylglycerophosphatase A
MNEAPASLYQTIVTLGGLGHARTAPGSWGSAAALIAGALLIATFGSVGLILMTFLVFTLGIWACDHYEAAKGVHDSPEIIIDEVAGQWIALVPLAVLGAHWLWYIAAFGLFRLFDIWKPGPIGTLDQKMKGGLGTMTDDLAAGLCAAVVLWLLV